MAKGKYLFAVLCESIMKEASTTISAIAKIPGGKELGQYLHKKYAIPHDFKLTTTSDIKLGRTNKGDRWDGGRWYIIAGEKGAAGLKYSNRTRNYHAVVQKPNDPKFYSYPTGTVGTVEFIDVENTSGKNVLNIIKSAIGKPIEIYAGDAYESEKVQQKQKRRKASRAAIEKTQLTYYNPEEYLLQKFKPTFLRALKNADAELRGMIQTQIKNGAYNAAEKKLKQLRILDKKIEDFELGLHQEDRPFLTAIRHAISLTAQHYYPELSGGIQATGDYVKVDIDGLHKLVDDIKTGDTKKLSTVLQYFKNMVLHLR